MKSKLLKLALLFGVLPALLAVFPTPRVRARWCAPTITADPNPANVPKGQTQGTTTLTWDGGTDHPYAEVWVKVDGNDETFIVESGKGTRQVPIELGKTYLFKLSDATELLASVTVTAKEQSTAPPASNNGADKIITTGDRSKLGTPKQRKVFKGRHGSTTTPPSTPREVVRLDILGGSSGTYFEYICEPQRVLIGIRGYSGSWIDNVQAVCARAASNTLEGGNPEGPSFGGAAGQFNNFAYCLPQAIAARLVVFETENRSALGSIFFGCQDFATKQLSGTSRTMQGGDPLATAIGVSQSCPANTVAVGIRGRAGTYVDGLGLICGNP